MDGPMSFETMAAAEVYALRDQMDRIDARILALYRSERDRAGEASRRAYEYVRSHCVGSAAEPPSERWRRGVYPLSVGG